MKGLVGRIAGWFRPAAEEIWKPVVGYEGRYEVSNFGGVRSLRHIGPKYHRVRRAPMILSARASTNGTLVVTFSRDGRRHEFQINWLVLEAFVGPRPPGHKAVFLDGNRRNCALSNLRWMTRAELVDLMRRRGTLQAGDQHYMRRHPERCARGEHHGGAKLSDMKVREIRRRAADTAPAVLAREFGVSRTTIDWVLAKRTWRHVL